jgi:nucleoside-diphosphate-sugar epimerase
MTSSILVTGGTGTLGRLVVRHLHTAGCEVRVLSRHSHESDPGIHYIVGDLLTGDGIDQAVEGVDAIVHCAGNFKSDAAMTRNLVQAAQKAGEPHLVFISVVGTDRIPVVGFGRLAFAYFGAKREAEEVVASSGLPWTTLRATQFTTSFSSSGKRWRSYRWRLSRRVSGFSRSRPTRWRRGSHPSHSGSPPAWLPTLAARASTECRNSSAATCARPITAGCSCPSGSQESRLAQSGPAATLWLRQSPRSP